MTIPEIVALATAGFTAQQIAALAAAPAAAPAAVPAAVPAAAPATLPSMPPQQTSTPDPMQTLMAQVGALTQAVQSANIGASAQPKAQTADEILAEIIQPPSMKKEG